MKTFEVKRKNGALNVESVFLLREMAFDIFKKYKNQSKGLERPIMAFDFLERSRERFEVSLTGEAAQEFLFQLSRSKVYRKIEKKICSYLRRYWGGYNIDVGLLPVAGETPPGPWHRDSHFYDSFSTESRGYYFTILVYLDKNAGSEFLLGSSLSNGEITSEFKSLKTSPNPGDLVFFDGRTIHRGLENNDPNERMALYITYTAKNYVDEEACLPLLDVLLNRKAS